MAKYTKYITKKLIIDKQYVKIINGKYIIEPFVFEARRLVKDKIPPQQPNDKQKPDKTKTKGKRMTEKRVNELIDKAIQKNNVYLLSEMDKKIEANNIVLLQAVRKIVKEEVRSAVKEEVHKEIAPINKKLDNVIKLNKLKTK